MSRLLRFLGLALLSFTTLFPNSVRAQSFYVSFSGGDVNLVSGGGASSPFGTSTGPEGMIVDSAGNLYLADDSANVVYKFTPSGTRTVFASGLTAPSDVAIDAAGNIYVANTTAGTIVKYSPDGATSSVFASLIAGPEALTFDLSGNLYVAQTNGITKFSPDGATSSVFAVLPNAVTLTFDSNFTHLYAGVGASGGITYYDLDGTAHVFTPAATAGTVADITFDGAGNFFFLDAGNDRILKFDSMGNQTIFATFTNQPSSFALVPEPATWSLMILALAVLVLVFWRSGLRKA